MNFDLFSVFYAPFGEWLDSLDTQGVSIRFKEQSLVVMQAREINRQTVLAYEKYTGVKTEERFQNLLAEFHTAREQRFQQSFRDKGMTEDQIQDMLFEHQEKSLEQRMQEFVQAQRDNSKLFPPINELVEETVTGSYTKKMGRVYTIIRLVPMINRGAWNPPHFLGDKCVRTAKEKSSRQPSEFRRWFSKWWMALGIHRRFLSPSKAADG